MKRMVKEKYSRFVHSMSLHAKRRKEELKAQKEALEDWLHSYDVRSVRFV